MYHLAHVEEKRRKWDETVSVKARNYSFTQRFPEIFSFILNLHPFNFFLFFHDEEGNLRHLCSLGFTRSYYFLFSDYFSQLLSGSAIHGALQLVSQDITRGNKLAALEMICQMAPGTLGGFGFHSCFIAIAGVWYIRHQISLLETDYSHPGPCDQRNHSTHLPNYPAPSRKNRNDQRVLLILRQ